MRLALLQLTVALGIATVSAYHYYELINRQFIRRITKRLLQVESLNYCPENIQKFLDRFAIVTVNKTGDYTTAVIATLNDTFMSGARAIDRTRYTHPDVGRVKLMFYQIFEAIALSRSVFDYILHDAWPVLSPQQQVQVTMETKEIREDLSTASELLELIGYCNGFPDYLKYFVRGDIDRYEAMYECLYHDLGCQGMTYQQILDQEWLIAFTQIGFAAQFLKATFRVQLNTHTASGRRIGEDELFNTPKVSQTLSNWTSTARDSVGGITTNYEALGYYAPSLAQNMFDLLDRSVKLLELENNIVEIDVTPFQKKVSKLIQERNDMAKAVSIALSLSYLNSKQQPYFDFFERPRKRLSELYNCPKILGDVAACLNSSRRNRLTDIVSVVRQITTGKRGLPQDFDIGLRDKMKFVETAILPKRVGSAVIRDCMQQIQQFRKNMNQLAKQGKTKVLQLLGDLYKEGKQGFDVSNGMGQMKKLMNMISGSRSAVGRLELGYFAKDLEKAYEVTESMIEEREAIVEALQLISLLTQCGPMPARLIEFAKGDTMCLIYFSMCIAAILPYSYGGATDVPERINCQKEFLDLKNEADEFMFSKYRLNYIVQQVKDSIHTSHLTPHCFAKPFWNYERKIMPTSITKWSDYIFAKLSVISKTAQEILSVFAVESEFCKIIDRVQQLRILEKRLLAKWTHRGGTPKFPIKDMRPTLVAIYKERADLFNAFITLSAMTSCSADLELVVKYFSIEFDNSYRLFKTCKEEAWVCLSNYQDLREKDEKSLYNASLNVIGDNLLENKIPYDI